MGILDEIGGGMLGVNALDFPNYIKHKQTLTRFCQSLYVLSCKDEL